jgi:hypothetical protein
MPKRPMASACCRSWGRQTLSREFGKGLDASNLRYMRLFCQL